MAQVSISIDDNLKERADELFDDLGMSMTTAFTIFVKAAVRQRGMPFEMQLNTPNEKTLEAIDDVNLNRNMSRPFSSVKELMEDLDADD